LPADTVLEGYNTWSGGFYLNGHTLTVGSGGIVIYENLGFPKIYGNGSLSSSSPYLNFTFKNSTHLKNGYVIESAIVDYRGHKVGLNISGGVEGYLTHVDLTGSVSNTFSGDIYISNLGGLQLYKLNGAEAVRGNIYVSDGGYLILSGSNQISDSSRIELDGRKRVATLYFCVLYNRNSSESVSGLKIDGSGVLDYSFPVTGGNPPGLHAFYLDDLDVSIDSKLTIRNWKLGRNHLLVRKDSGHLYDALTRIKFEGYKEWRAGLKDFDKDYWQLIPDIPEPSTYGAVLGAVGLGVFFLRRRKRLCLTDN